MDSTKEQIQALYSMIAILTQRLGGKVEITFDEIDNPPTGELIRNVQSETITIKIIKDETTDDTRDSSKTPV